MRNKKVMVTGANGHLGNTLVKALCDKGYSVNATVRDVDYVKSEGIFDGYNISLFKADIRDEAAIEKAMEGVQGVFQVAALYNYDEQSLGEGIVENNTQGTHVVLKLAKNLGVDRVILTSSIAAVGFGGTKEEPMTEDSWSDPKDPYCCSKMKSEKDAWEFAKHNDLDLVTLCPSMIFGPNFYKHTASTVNAAAFINNQVPFCFSMETSIVDVRDVAEAHILAYENKVASGRYLVSGLHISDFSGLLKEFDPEMELPERVLTVEETKVFAEKSGAPSELIGHSYIYSDEKSKNELGWKMRPISETILSTIEWIKTRSM